MKRLAVEHYYEWSIAMPNLDFEKLPREEFDNQNDRALANWKDNQNGEDTIEVSRVVLKTRLYLDADLTTELVVGNVSHEIFITRYPDLLKNHWLQINSDLQSFNKLLLQFKVVLLGMTSVTFLLDISDPVVAWSLLAGNVGSFVFPKAFSKSVVFVAKRFVKI